LFQSLQPTVSLNKTAASETAVSVRSITDTLTISENSIVPNTYKQVQPAVIPKPMVSSGNTTHIPSVDQKSPQSQVHGSAITFPYTAPHVVTISRYYDDALVSVVTQSKTHVPGKGWVYDTKIEGEDAYLERVADQYTYKATVTDANGKIIAEYDGKNIIMGWNSDSGKWATMQFLPNSTSNEETTCEVENGTTKELDETIEDSTSSALLKRLREALAERHDRIRIIAQ